MKNFFFVLIIGSVFILFFVFYRKNFDSDRKLQNVEITQKESQNSAEVNQTSQSSETTQNLRKNVFEGEGIKDFTLKHTGEVTKTTVEDITTFTFPEGSVSVMPSAYEGILRHSITVQQEEAIIIDGRSAVKIFGASAKDGTPIIYILLTEANKLYEFQGSDTFLTTLVPQTFHFLP